MRLFLLLSLAVTASSCDLLSGLDAVESPPYAPELALPLIHSTVAVGDLLKGFESVGNAIFIDSADILHFRYQGDLLTRSGAEIFSRIGASLPPVIPMVSDSLSLPLTLPDGAILDRVDLKTGLLSFYAENPNPEPVNVKLTLPDLRRQGIPFSLDFSIPGYGGTGQRPAVTNAISPASLAGYSLLPNRQSIRLQYEARNPKGEKLSLSPFFLQLTNLAFSYFEGYLGRLLYEGEIDTVRIDFFDQRYIQGNIQFANPTVSFSFENSIGVPTLALVNTFEVLNVKGERIPVESPAIRSGIAFPFPSLNEVGQTRRAVFTFTRENSNIRELLSSGPVAVIYDVDALTHPGGNTSERGFVTDKSFYRIGAEVDLPFVGQVSEFEVDQDFSLDLSDFRSASSIALKLISENGIPLDLDVQGYFLNASGQVVDSMLAAPQRLIRGAPTGANGLPQGIGAKTTEIIYEQNRLEKILLCNRLRLKAGLSTDSNRGREVKILSGQRLKIRLSARAHL